MHNSFILFLHKYVWYICCQSVSYKGLHVTSVIRFVPELLPWIQVAPVYRLGIVTYSGHIHVQQSAIDACLTMDEVTRGKNTNLSRRSKPETFLLNSNQQYYWDYNQLVTQKCTTQVHNSAKSLPNLWENILYLTRSLIYPIIHIKCFWLEVRLHRQKFYHLLQCKIFILTYGCYSQFDWSTFTPLHSNNNVILQKID